MRDFFIQISVMIFITMFILYWIMGTGFDIIQIAILLLASVAVSFFITIFKYFG